MARPLVSLSEKRADTPEEVRAQTMRSLLGASLGGLGAGVLGGGLWHLIRDYLRGESPERRAPTLQLSALRSAAPDAEEEDEEELSEELSEALGQERPVEYAKAAGYWSELAGNLANPINHFGGSLVGAIAAPFSETRKLREQAAADKDLWKNFLIPGWASHNAMKRLGHSIRGPEIAEAREDLEDERVDERHEVRKKRDGDGDGKVNDGTPAEKDASFLQPYTPTSMADVTWEPAAYIAAAGLSAGAGWELISWLRKRALKVKREQELTAAREEYEAALRDQFGTKEGAATKYASLDNLYDAVSVHLTEKSARGPLTGYTAVPGSGIAKDVLTSIKDMMFSPAVSRDYWKYAVVTPALLAALGFGYSGYASQRDRSKEKALTEALRRREIELRARKPVPLRAVDAAEEE
jgi:hypothetical protein